MNLDLYRPKSSTVTAIEMALAAAIADEASIASTTTDALTRRDNALLDGSQKELQAAETALINARGDAERLSAIVTRLRARLETAREEEALGRVRNAEQVLAAARAAMDVFATESGALLLQLHEEAFHASQAIEQARFQLQRAQRNVMDAFPRLADRAAVPETSSDLSPAGAELADVYTSLVGTPLERTASHVTVA